MPSRITATIPDPEPTAALADPRSRNGLDADIPAPADAAVRRAWTARRACAAAAAAGPVVFLAVTALAGLLKPGYDLRDQSVSELAVGAHGWIQTANFFILGAAMLAFAFALGAGRKRGPRSANTVALLAVAGAGVFASGLFPTDPVGAPVTSHGAVHNTLFPLVLVALIAAYALHGRALRRAGVDRGLARYSTATAVGIFALVVAFGGFAGDVGDPLHDVSGLLQRALLGVAFGWITVVGGRLARAQPN